MPQAINAKNLRLNLKEILKLVEAGMKFDVTYRSKVVAQLVPRIGKAKNKGSSKEVINFLKFFKPAKRKQSTKITEKSTKEMYSETMSEKYKDYL